MRIRTRVTRDNSIVSCSTSFTGDGEKNASDDENFATPWRGNFRSAHETLWRTSFAVQCERSCFDQSTGTVFAGLRADLGCRVRRSPLTSLDCTLVPRVIAAPQGADGASTIGDCSTRLAAKAQIRGQTCWVGAASLGADFRDSLTEENYVQVLCEVRRRPGAQAIDTPDLRPIVCFGCDPEFVRGHDPLRFQWI